MAIVRASRPFDMTSADFLDVSGGDLQPATVSGTVGPDNTFYVYFEEEGGKPGPILTVRGQGFDYSEIFGRTIPTEGAIQSLDIGSYNNKNVFVRDVTIHGLDIKVSDVVEAAISGDYQSVLKKAFSGADDFFGSKGDDKFLGFAGDDLFFGDKGADYYDGGAGKNDIVDYSLSTKGLLIDLTPTSATYTSESTGFAAGDVFKGIERINGSAKADTFLASDAGKVTFDGLGGRDVYFGADGVDTFRFSAALSTGADKINNFTVGQDEIELSTEVFTTVKENSGGIRASQFVVVTDRNFDITTDLDSSDRIIYNSLNGRLFYDEDGSGAAKAVLFATVSANAVLTRGDFDLFTPAG